MSGAFTIGLDFGTNSVRALIVDTATGEEIATSAWNYSHGRDGVIIDDMDPHLARQHPQDYLDGIEAGIVACLAQASRRRGFSADNVIGIGVDTTGSTPIPVDGDGTALACKEDFADNTNAMAWLWKDHTAHEEAAEITAAAARERPQYLAKCGGRYSSEWFWSKILHCLRVDEQLFSAAHTWVECADWIPAVLTGTQSPGRMKRGICAAGHKAMFHPTWGGYPDEEFLAGIDPGLRAVRRRLPQRAYTVADPAGALTDEWADRLGLPAGIPVATGAFDAHLGAAGSAVRPGVLVKIIGTSTCDCAVWPLDADLPDIPGVCGIVPESILPGMYGLEAGQSAVGDIFNWFVSHIRPGGEAGSHETLTREAAALLPGQSGLLALDWHNGNRTILVDQRLTGLLVGMTLHTTSAEIYRALIEATAFGARVIIERFEEYGVRIDRVVSCGGIAARNPLVMQIYADVMNRTMDIAQSDQTCALGAAMAGAVVAGTAAGGHDDFAGAQEAMCAFRDQSFRPDPERSAVYHRLYLLYRRLHDAFGAGKSGDMQDIMKKLLSIRDEVRG